ncbi:Surfeit locus protein 4 [Scheffersomyces spartinae]|uniref:Surfeit locus protein 4 n=1 Tax=Scheffersomyces spartinae TaxID=45513 RepID=A0A9P7V6Z2_9ASCO|nr:Surfeit locus protein 4 [Scheffersomyces spartinae]KAG7192360.1 Surfeit locus protein 4 [Scheffersomyces spartinae]
MSGFAPPPPPISSASSTSPGDANILERFEAVAKKVEDAIDTYCLPLKPYVPGIGRAFIVATFYEDSLRIISQWAEQVYYLHNYKHRWRWLTVLFLSLNVLLMLVASSLLVVRKLTNVSTSVLVGVVVFQGLFYGLILDPQFLLRNLSVVGGLILAYSDSIVRDIRKLSIAGIPQLQNQDNKKYFLLAGRLLLIALFTGFAFSAKFSFGRLLIIVVGLISCASIVVGYKTKFAAFVLTVLLFTYNMFVNQFWNYSSHDPNRDYLRYEFFQTLSIVGGLLLIVNAGAGELSFDEKKKIY